MLRCKSRNYKKQIHHNRRQTNWFKNILRHCKRRCNYKHNVSRNSCKWPNNNRKCSPWTWNSECRIILNKYGLKITGAGTSTIVIDGEENLDNGVTEVFPDRIEASTYIIIGALAGKDLKIKGFIKDHINSVLIKLKDAGVDFDITADTLTISKCPKLLPTTIKTQVFPGFPTDVQQVFTVLLTQAEGTSEIIETIYESRFMSASLLNKMGANTFSVGNTLTITGPTPLTATELYIPDLRGGAALLTAGLIAQGETILDNIPLILRGYEDIVEKLTNVGAELQIIS